MLKISEVLRLKSDVLYTASPDDPISLAVETMSKHNLGSLIIMEFGELAGIVTFSELISHFQNNGGVVGNGTIRSIMNDAPISISPNTDMNEVQRLMLDHRVRYVPVMDGPMLLGVISFSDMTRAVLHIQQFENSMLKAYIRDWPNDQGPDTNH